MPQIHVERRARLAELVAGRDLAAALITHPVNLRYLTGLVSSNAALLVRADGTARLVTDGRYAGTARRVCPDVELTVARGCAQRLVSEEHGRLAFEAHHVTVERHAELAGLGADLVALGPAVEGLRTVKDEGEIEFLREACRSTDQAFTAVLSRVRAGATEREIAIALDRAMVDLGAEGPAFDTIVAAGANGAIPHHVPGERTIEAGDLVTMDFGARIGGYHADLTRTVAVGSAAGWQRDIYDLVAAAQAAGVAAARPGAEVADVDAVARELIEAAGHGEHFPHPLGHGVGLEIHEAPLVGWDKTGRLDVRVPVTVEPGVYVPGRGGVRIEDTIVVRDRGPELLTETTKELLVV